MDSLINTIVPIESARPFCVGFDEEKLMISSEAHHENMESLCAHTKSFGRSGTNGYSSILLKQIRKIRYDANKGEFFIQSKDVDRAKLKKSYLIIANDATRAAFCKSLAKASGLHAEKEFDNPFVGIFEHTVFFVLTVIFTYAFQHVARTGIDYTRRPTVKLVAELLELMGPQIPTIVGGIIGCYYLYKIIRNFLKPGKTIVYT